MSPFKVASGEEERGALLLDLSKERRRDTLDEVGMAGVVTVPLARVTVLTWVSSLLALLNMVAPASEDENLGGKCGRRRGEFEKKRGEGGSKWPTESAMEPKWSSVCLGRIFLRAGCEPGVLGGSKAALRFLALLLVADGPCQR